MPQKALIKKLLWVTAGIALIVPTAFIAARPDMVAKLRETGVRRAVLKVWYRIRRDGIAATVNEAFGRSDTSKPLSASTLRYSLYDPTSMPAVEDSTARRSLAEYIDVAAVDVSRLPASQSSTRAFVSWNRSGGDETSSKYSSLDQITTGNVHRLQPAWSYSSGSDLGDSTKTGGLTVETNPIVAGGRLFVSTIDGDLVSVDAESGDEIWRLALPAPVARRGLIWEPNSDFSKSRLFVPSNKGVYAVNAATGKVISEYGANGVVGSGASLIAPLIIDDKLIVATLTPALEAYSLSSGALVWTRPLLDIPDSSATRLSGGSPWGGMSADLSRKTVYVVTGNPRPALIGTSRPGKNAYSCSIVAIDAVTGTVRWSFQEVEHDLWDLDLAAAPLLTTITRAGRWIDVVAALTKRGNTVLLDRDRGQPIFGYRLRRAPTSAIPGEQTAPYQPVFSLPEPFASQEFRREDITKLSTNAQRSAARKLRGATFGFFEPPVIGGTVALFGIHGGAEWPGGAVDPAKGLLYVPSNQIPWVIRTQYADVKATPQSGADLPGDRLYKANCARCHGQSRGGKYEWEGTGDAFIPALTGITLLRRRDQLESTNYLKEQHEDGVASSVSASDLRSLYSYFETLDRRADAQRSFALNAFWQLVLDDNGNPASNPPWGMLTAIDLNSGRKIWQVPFGEVEGMGPNGGSVKGLQNIGGVVATAGGLLFATGTTDNKVRAYDAANGVELWSYKLPAAGSTYPTVYAVNGQQYVVVVATGGGFRGFSGRSDHIIAFRLPAANR